MPRFAAPGRGSWAAGCCIGDGSGGGGRGTWGLRLALAALAALGLGLGLVLCGSVPRENGHLARAHLVLQRAASGAAGVLSAGAAAVRLRGGGGVALGADFGEVPIPQYQGERCGAGRTQRFLPARVCSAAPPAAGAGAARRSAPACPAPLVRAGPVPSKPLPTINPPTQPPHPHRRPPPLQAATAGPAWAGEVRLQAGAQGLL